MKPTIHTFENLAHGLQMDLEELDALMLAQTNGETVSSRFRTRYTPTPQTRYYSDLQQVEQ